ncbi:unnamed protein product [Zymoseptoria tritici ST99CH_3D1]|nr:unnamed protein product [Zymoseptoria tritici ST99CH_3D1]
MDHVPPLPKPGRLWKNKADFFRPFRNAGNDSSSSHDSTITPLFDPSLPRTEATEPDLADLNAALSALVDVFPDVQPEVFREMLVSVGPDSRLQVVTEHLLQKKAKWVQGRYRIPTKAQTQARSETVKLRRGRRERMRDGRPVPSGPDVEHEDLFRSESYKKAVKHVLYLEFRNLSHSIIKGVLAEQNFSYTLARPVLQQVASKSWRFSLSSFWPKRSTSSIADGHPFITWQPTGDADGQATPALRRTGDEDLDRELYDLFVGPIVSRQRQDRMIADFREASRINEAEAENAEALFDCECCYTSVPFEKIACCDDGCHFLCLDCIRRTVNEALYGQGWSRTADLRRATVRCFAPATEECTGCMPGELVKRALTQGSDNEDAWHDFQARITTDVLLQCHLPLQRCPFCSYAEIDEVPPARLRHPMAVWRHIATKANPAVQIIFTSFLTLLSIFTLPLIILSLALSLLIPLIPPLRTPFTNSLARIHRARRGFRFHCQSPTCAQVSCTRCTAAWRDPHICFESEKSSLRHAIEASATAAVKRTCPKCMLSFVKASGCNKLVCNCGYTMCYICRQEITSKEGYGHFCQHFRPAGGRCGDCERCDLYGDEDEEKAIRTAARKAEEVWREKEGGKGKVGGEQEVAKAMVDALVGREGKEWYDVYLDAMLDAVIA